MKEEDRKKIDKIIDGMHCPKNFKCLENGFKRLCKAKGCGVDDFLECLEGNQLLPCSYMLKVDKMVFCQCPLRVHIAKNINK